MGTAPMEGRARMFRVRLSTAYPHFPLIGQTPGRRGRWGKYEFVIDPPGETDRPISDYDFWIVCDRFGSPLSGQCAKANVIYFTAEPPSLARYPRKFLSQFGAVVTCHRYVRHPHTIFSQQALPWHIGIGSYHNRERKPELMDYDRLKSARIEKPKLLSVIASASRGTRGHAQRYEFVQYLQKRLGNRVDVFGHGIRELGCKWDGIAPYKYHVAIENSVLADYWTEKLADAFLGGAFPFYHGCPNIGKYFSPGSLQTIDISDPAAAARIIERTITSGVFEKRQEEIAEARRLVLDEYNLFAVAAKLCAQRDKSAPKEALEFRPIKEFENAAVRVRRMISSRAPAGVRRLFK